MFVFHKSTVFTTEYLLRLSEPVYIAPAKQRSYNSVTGCAEFSPSLTPCLL
jgi:hypothetical protein